MANEVNTRRRALEIMHRRINKTLETTALSQPERDLLDNLVWLGFLNEKQIDSIAQLYQPANDNDEGLIDAPYYSDGN